MIDAKNFENSFGKCILKSELEKKYFLLKNISGFQDISKNKFDAIYSTMQTKNLLKNEVVYYENDPAEYIYIIYQGLFKLKKFEKDNNQIVEIGKNIDPTNSKLHTVLSLDKGDFAGLEALFITPTNKENYKYTLVANSDYNVAIALNLKFLDQDLKKKIFDNLKNMFQHKEDILNDIMNKHKQIKEKFKITYRETTLDLIAKSKDNQRIGKKIIKKLNEVSEENLHRKIETKNEFKNFKIDKSKIPITFKTIKNEKKIKLPKLKIIENIPKQKSVTSRKAKKAHTDQYSSNCSLCKFTHTEEQQNNGSTLNLSNNFFQTISQKNYISKDYKEYYTQPSIADLYSVIIKEKKNPKLNRSNSISYNETTKNNFNTEETDLKEIQKSDERNKKMNKKQYIKQVLSNNSKISGSMFLTKPVTHINKFITKSVQNWSNSKSEYNSGIFELPLISQYIK